MAQIIWSWQCCRLLVGNIANGIASKNVFAFLTELGNFKQKFVWRQCHWQCCQTKVCSIVKNRWFGPIYIYEIICNITFVKAFHYLTGRIMCNWVRWIREGMSFGNIGNKCFGNQASDWLDSVVKNTTWNMIFID